MTTKSSIRNSVLTVTGTKPLPTSITNTTVTINAANAVNGTPAPGNQTFNANPNTPKPLNGADFGTFDVNTGQLILNGGTATTFESGGDKVTGVVLTFFVFKNGSPQGNPVALALSQIGDVTNGTRQFALTDAQINLISNLANQGTGTYNFQVLSFTASITKGNGSFGSIVDNNKGNLYTAQFTLNGVPIETDTWLGTTSDDWFTPANWSLGRLPNAITNVIVPNFIGGSNNVYPNIYAGVTYTTTLFGGGKGPVKDNTNSGPALARNLLLDGESSTIDRAILRLVKGRLVVYGDFSNQYDSFIARNNVVFEYASSSLQQMDTGTYSTVVVSGGGTKNLNGLHGPMLVNEQLIFDSSKGPTIITTNPKLTNIAYINLADRLAVNNNNGAQLVNENDSNYILGLIKTTRSSVSANETDANGNPDPRTFGGIGITSLFTGTNPPGDIAVTRSTQSNYALLGNRISVRRVFGFRPTNAGLLSLQANMTFSCLPNETIHLQPNDASIAEQDLTLFLSTNNGDTFSVLGRDAVPVNYTVVKSGITSFATFTLGDVTKPLPVSLVAFDAKRTGNDGLLTWTTASEKNNKGFDVQVSTDGKEFRTIAFVASQSSNSAARLNYSFVDAEANKSGNRYYRLHQVDLDGKGDFSPVRTLNFSGAAPTATSTLLGYPNPFTSELNVSIAGAGNGAATLRLTDLAGRTIRTQQVSLEGASSNLKLDGLGDLKAGTYIMQMTTPSGKTQTFKVQKQ